jgi:hypothetical protein
MFVSERMINSFAFNTGWTMDMLCDYFYYLTGANWGNDLREGLCVS